MQLWIISGACRGVGKTYLAKKLGALLPAATYAKLGHGQPRRDKSANLFHSEEELAAFISACRGKYDHVIVESNSTQPPDGGAIRIFIDAGSAQSNLRADRNRLRRQAQLRVDATASAKEWAAALRPCLKDAELREAICGILAEQQRRLRPARLAVRSKVWLINEDDQHVFGSGLAKLLEEVAHLGSLKAAATVEGMSYRHAWGAIRQAERNLGVRLLATSAGGAGGGGSVLTAEAKHVLALFQRLSEKASAAADREFSTNQRLEASEHAS